VSLQVEEISRGASTQVKEPIIALGRPKGSFSTYNTLGFILVLFSNYRVYIHLVYSLFLEKIKKEKKNTPFCLNRFKNKIKIEGFFLFYCNILYIFEKKI